MSAKKYEILKDSLLGMYVKDLTSTAVHTASHVRNLVQQGARARATRAPRARRLRRAAHSSPTRPLPRAQATSTGARP